MGVDSALWGKEKNQIHHSADTRGGSGRTRQESRGVWCSSRTRESLSALLTRGEELAAHPSNPLHSAMLLFCIHCVIRRVRSNCIFYFILFFFVMCIPCIYNAIAYLFRAIRVSVWECIYDLLFHERREFLKSKQFHFRKKTMKSIFSLITQK